jgi:hypothetical protein
VVDNEKGLIVTDGDFYQQPTKGGKKVNLKKFKIIHDLKEIEDKKVVEVIHNEDSSMLAEPLIFIFEDGSIVFLHHPKNDEDKDKKLSEIFHALWSKAIKCHNYDKKEWATLWGILQSKGIHA